MLPEWVRPGIKFRCFRTVYHVRGIVDGQAVMRRWRFSERYWVYEVEDEFWFKINEPHIKRIKS